MNLDEYNDFSRLEGKQVMITVGMYDGVHLGHRFFINKFIEEAKMRNLEPVLISMYPHPQTILKENDIKYLTTLSEKKYHLFELGLHHFIVLDTNKELLNKSASEFISYIESKGFFVDAVAMGFNNRFGKKDANEKPFDQILRDLNIEYVIIPPFYKKVSSSLIREDLKNGRVEDAADLLGYKYTLSGKVIKGNQLGRKIGFPTANIKPASDEKILPATGVYFVKCSLQNSVYPGMMNIGYRPTVSNHSKELSIEVHIPGKNLNIYDHNITLEFCSRIRAEKKFASIDELKNQLSKDKERLFQYIDQNGCK